MCFSATASFAVAATLLPVGVYCVRAARLIGFRWLPFALYPIAFSIQQAIEGILWLGINLDDQSIVTVASRGFVFFSHFFWLAWVPFSVYALERDLWRRRLLAALTGIGILSGLSISLPLLISTDWLSIVLVQGSLEYKTVLIYDDFISRNVLRGLYTLLIVSSLFLSTHQRIRLFGGLILASLLIAEHFFAYALISVWCFLAAVLSTYILSIVLNERRAQTVQVS